MSASSDASIHFDSVDLGYGGRAIVSGLSGAIRPGEFIAVLGPNGSGKTTLLKAVLGLVRPLAGRTEVFGQAPARGDPRIGYLPQRRSLEAAAPLNARAYLHAAIDGHRWGLAWPRRANGGSVRDAIRLADAEAFADRPWSVLSGGERQRIALAQALIGRPEMLLLDEPLLSLDPRRQGELVEVVESVRRSLNLTVLFTSHDVNPLMRVMDRVLYLAGGNAAFGPVERIITSESLSRLYRVAMKVCQAENLVLIAPEGAPRG